MKRRSKNRLVNRDVVNEDLISELPEPLLLHVLSLVPSETAIATSVLSKRWKSLWKMIPNLRFDSQYHDTFAENVSSSLILHKAPILESLSLTFGDKCDPLELTLLMGIAFSRKVRKLVLKLEEEDFDDPLIFPDIVLRCNNALEILKLHGPTLLDLTSPACLNSLRELHLYYIKFDDQESISNLLSGCPRLKDLVWHPSLFVGPLNITIAVPSLQRLTFVIDDRTQSDGGYVINAPSLKYLYMSGFWGIEFCLIEDAPELVEATITDIGGLSNENILESLVAAKCLSLGISPLEIKYPVGKIFYQLLSLELHTSEEEWWNLLSLMLESSPKLQNLKLIGHHDHVRKRPKWNEPKCVPECLLFHLETFVWKKYMEHGNEKEVATYILKNAQCLKKATFFTNKPTTLEIEKSREMLNQLANEVRASNSCHLVFKSDRYFYRNQKDADLDRCEKEVDGFWVDTKLKVRR